MKAEQILRKHLLDLLRGGNAHVTFDRAVGGLPPNLRGACPRGLPHSLWRLLEHMRIAQWDILEFCRNPKHVSPDWPKGYWPAGDAPKKPADWGKSVKTFRNDLKAMETLVANPKTDLFAAIPHG